MQLVILISANRGGVKVSTFTRKTLQFLILVIISTSALGQTNTLIAYGNGVWTDRESAGESLVELKNQVKNRFSQDEFSQVEFHLAYNHTDGKILDLWESASQTVRLSLSGFYRILGGLSILPDSLQEALIDLSVAFDEFSLRNTDVEDHVFAPKSCKPIFLRQIPLFKYG